MTSQRTYWRSGPWLIVGLALVIAGCAKQDERQLMTIVVGGGILNSSAGQGASLAVFSPDGATFVDGSGDWSVRDETMRLWDARTGKLIRTLSDEGMRDRVSAVAFDTSGEKLATGHGQNIRIWQPRNGALLKKLTARFYRVRDVSFSPDGKTLAGCYSAGVLVLWNTENGSVLRTLWPTRGEGSFTGAKFSPDGREIIAGMSNGQVMMLLAMDGTIVRTFGQTNREMTFLSMSLDGSRVAARYADGEVRIWNRKDGSVVHTLMTDSLRECCLALNRTGGLLAVGSAYPFRYENRGLFEWIIETREYTVELYRTGEGSLLCTLRGHKWDVTSVDFSPTQAVLASRSIDESIKLWNVEGLR